MAFGDKYTWTLESRQRTWSFAFREEGFTTTASVVQSSGFAKIIWGEQTNELDDRVLASDMRIDILDPGSVIYLDLSTTLLEEEDFEILLTDSTSTYTYRAHVRLDTVRTFLVDNLETPITTLYAYDGLTNFAEIDAQLDTTKTFHDIFRVALASENIGQDIQYISALYPENVSASGAVLDQIRLNRLDLIFAEEGRKIDNQSSQIKGLLEALDLALWNGFDGQWHVKNRFALGEDVPDRAPQLYTHASTSVATNSTLSQTTFAATDPLWRRIPFKQIGRPIQNVEISQGTDRDFITTDIIKHGDMETGWISTTEHDVWRVDGGGDILQDAQADTGSFSLRLGTATSIVRQETLYQAASQKRRFNIVYRYAHELTLVGAAATATTAIELTLEPFDTTLPLYYADATSWSTTSAHFTVSQTPAANGAGLSWATFDQLIEADLPAVDGIIRLQFTGNINADWWSYVDNVELSIQDKDNVDINNFRSVYTRLDDSGAAVNKGEVVRQARAWFAGILGLDTDADDVRDETHRMLQADPSGVGTSWEQASRWTSEVDAQTGLLFTDLGELSAAVRIAQQQTNIELVEGEVMGIVPPETALTYEGDTYVPVYSEVDLQKETTKLVLVKKQLNLGSPSVNKIWVLAEDDEVWSMPVDSFTLSSVFTPSLSASHVAAYLVVDQGAGLIFILSSHTSLVDYEINKWDLAGGSKTNVLTVAGDATHVALDRLNQRIYYVHGSSQMRSCTYTGADITTHFTKTVINGGPFINSGHTKLYFHSVTGGTQTQWYMDLSDDSLTQFGSYSGLSTGANGEGAVHESQDLYFANKQNASTHKVVISTGVGTQLNNDPFLGSQGMTIDRGRSKLYFTEGVNGEIHQMNYDSTGEVTVATIGGGIEALSLSTGVG